MSLCAAEEGDGSVRRLGLGPVVAHDYIKRMLFSFMALKLLCTCFGNDGEDVSRLCCHGLFTWSRIKKC